jgi:hypothetical protein
VQELLGDHQDAVLARPVLREIGMAAHLDGENGFSYGILYEQETAGTHLARPVVDDAFRKLRRNAHDLLH